MLVCVDVWAHSLEKSNRDFEAQLKEATDSKAAALSSSNEAIVSLQKQLDVALQEQQSLTSLAPPLSPLNPPTKLSTSARPVTVLQT